MMKRKINPIEEQNFRFTLMVLLFLVSTCALGVGYYFMKDPQGKILGFNTSYLSFSPFANYFWPGFILFVCLGITGLLCFISVLMRYHNYPLLVVIQGEMLLGWVLIQIILARDFNLLHVICLITGALLIIAGRLICK